MSKVEFVGRKGQNNGKIRENRSRKWEDRPTSVAAMQKLESPLLR